MNRTAALAGLLAAAGLLLTGCSSSSSPGGGTHPSTSAKTSTMPGTGTTAAMPSTPAAGAAKIVIKNFAYTVSGAVTPGAKVSVTNDDGTAHTVTADSAGGFDVTVQPGKTATLTAPDKAGTYKFHCTFHANMHGTLTVG